VSDIKCPDCGTENEINHDDGQGYEEDLEHTQDCSSCNVEFKFSTSIMYCYEVFCGEDTPHKLELYKDDFYFCENCEYVQKGVHCD
jgi:hypothetical protein